MRKQLYLEIKQRLKTIFTANGEQLFQHFDLWNQQVEFIEEETPFASPAVFVEFGRMDWHTMGQRAQRCKLTVRLHIVTEWHSGTADYSPTEEASLEFLELTDNVVAAMQNFATPYMNSWMRTATITNHNHDRYVDNVEEYTCELVDTSACPTYATVQATPQVVAE